MNDNIFMMDKNLMADIIAGIRSLKVDVSNFDEADRWVGIVMLLERAMNPPVPETHVEMEALNKKDDVVFKERKD